VYKHTPSIKNGIKRNDKAASIPSMYWFKENSKKNLEKPKNERTKKKDKKLIGKRKLKK